MRILILATLLFASVSAYAAQSERKIVVVLKEQKLYALEKVEPDPEMVVLASDQDEASPPALAWKVVYAFHCSTGRRGMSTPIGSTSIQHKMRVGRALAEFGGGKLAYVMQVHLYDTAKKKFRRIDIHAYKSVPQHPASHGCIRLKKPNAQKLFGWAGVGIPVEIVKTRPAWLPKS